MALTHFCDLHGPKTILCTQVRPLECNLCVSPSPLPRKNSCESYTSQIQDEEPQREIRPPRRLRRTDTDLTLSSELSQPSPAVDDGNATDSIEAHHLYRRSDCSRELGKTPYDRSRNASCASCTFTVPRPTAAKIPPGSPGSIKDGGAVKSEPPVLRSREFVCLGKGRNKHSHEEPSSSQESQTSSIASYGSVGSQGDCHDHTLTYLTSKSPDDQSTFMKLGKSVIRALSCEVLPKGQSEGPFCFGDSTSGYTIAYVFRLTDPKARGRRRAYAFVALAGTDAHRAFKACPMLWKAFHALSTLIEQAAQQYQEEQEIQQQKTREQELARQGQAYTPISSFLTQRPRDPDGQPRRAGQTQPRSLAEIIGDENIFAILHSYFVRILRDLGDRFGGLPVAEDNSVIHSTVHETTASTNTIPRMSADLLANMSLEDVNEEPEINQSIDSARRTMTGSTMVTSNSVSTTTSTLSSSTLNDRPSSKHSNTGSTRTIKRNSQCADTVSVDVARPRQVAV